SSGGVSSAATRSTRGPIACSPSSRRCGGERGPRHLGGDHDAQRGRRRRRAARAHRCRARRPRVGGDRRRRRLDRRDFRAAPRGPRARPAHPRCSLQAQRRPASGDARRPRARPRRVHRDDGRRLAESARGPAEAARRARPCGRRFGPARCAPGLARAYPAEPRDQRHAPTLHRRAHLRLLLRLQRVPPGRDRADARGDRPPEIHEGARALDRRVGRGGRRRPRAVADRLALLAVSPRPPRAARRRRLLAAARPVDRRLARRALHARLSRARHLRRRLLDRQGELPGAALRRCRHRARPRCARLRPRADRRVARPHPARRRGTADVRDRGGAVSRRVLVTGGAGFISSNVIRHLLEATPYEVVTLDALTYAGNLENLADVMSHPRLSFVHGDIRHAALVRDLVEGVDVIVNAAAESHVEKSIADGASEFVTTNVEGTQILLDAIRERPVERFILISSSEVYGTAEHAPMDEEHPLNPRSPYAATKAGADRLAYAYWTTYELPIVIVRPFNNYGPRQHPEKLVPKFITQAMDDEPLTIHGD